MPEEAPHKAHRPSQAGKKAEKKDVAQGKDKTGGHKGFNEKAFTSSSFRSANLQARRAAEKDQQRLHVPLVNRTPAERKIVATLGPDGKPIIPSEFDAAPPPPPIIIAIVGPPGVGKTTLMKSLVKRYTKHTVSEIRGPVTVVAGKSRRLTFVECGNDLNSMIDIAKIADLVMLMIDGSFGFEMETFEFINVLQSHGFPKVVGILTHLDLIKKSAILTDTKKRLKHRFWTEIYQGAKLFYLSGVLNGRYPDQEITNLSRFISVIKFRPLIFRNQHPYLLADRIQDLTSPLLIRSNPKADRTITLYGWLRGINLPSENASVHIPGAGDLVVKTVERLPDPCPLPTLETERRRKMGEKGKLIHAPMSDVGGMTFDKDAVYVNVMGSFTRRGEDDEGVMQGEGEKMVMDLQDMSDTLADGIAKSNIRLLGSSSKPLQHETPVAPAQPRQRRSASDRGAYAAAAAATEENDDDEESLNGGEEEDDEDVDDFDEQAYEDDHEEYPRAGPSRLKGAYEIGNAKGRTQGDKAEFAESDDELDLDDVVGFEQDGGRTRDLDIEYGDSEEEDLLDVVIDPSRGGMSEKWKENGAGQDVEDALQNRRRDLMSLIYNSGLTPEEIASGMKSKDDGPQVTKEEDDLFTVTRKQAKTEFGSDAADQLKSSAADVESLRAKWAVESMLQSIKHMFITGPRDEEDGVDGEKYEQEGGDFEDLEGGDGSEDEDEDGKPKAPGADVPYVGQGGTSLHTAEASLAAKKELLKRKFDEQYDDEDEDAAKLDFYDERKAEMAKQLELNESEFAGIDAETRARIEGYRAGCYVRLEIENVPCELVDNFDPRNPIIVGGLLAAEERFGYLTVRIKRHRWHVKTLKTNDPLIFSLGWRRFQSLPIYSLDDHSIRNRYLKYTPEHMHCYATFYGPISAPNTGFCAFNTLSSNVPAFRVSATGVVLDVDRTTRIVKKIKLTGVPTKVFKNTAFVRDMFNSALEVAKFEGASIRTVSGVRGQIKKALAKPEGNFRATFEDKILMSDIIFLRAWSAIEPRKLYNPVTSLLLNNKDGEGWRGMRLTGEVRRDEGVKTPKDVNSAYRPIVRPTRRFNTLKIPRKLAGALPYASKPKIALPQKHATYLQSRAVVLEPTERKAVALLQQIQSLRKEKITKRAEKKGEQRERYVKKREEEEERKGEKRKEERKGLLRDGSIKRKREAESEGGRRGGGKKSKRGD